MAFLHERGISVASHNDSDYRNWELDNPIVLECSESWFVGGIPILSPTSPYGHVLLLAKLSVHRSEAFRPLCQQTEQGSKLAGVIPIVLAKTASWTHDKALRLMK